MEVGLTSTINVVNNVVSISSPKMPVYQPIEKMKKNIIYESCVVTSQWGLRKGQLLTFCQQGAKV